ncbi:catechol 2,3-dioxygenase-like lactoylglutathione lyase family enzyme [Endobacter medicaginis]|uniref:Catechol 2,3-dioxygenase-like lactoylglutathione lyase family enzyme n=2 Tax=Endobacter medicaginis TaxID=1181271 RepID=A0A839UZ06_9PROT|nr:VOC family protein [Endobacter medicaginis]MBB3175026.1 catechol 2,3-dioxygenase-like lactoylglutathione lyase family enzyme [Endobacter medicaginis]MCX5475948.1 VOC family protein [Endobacter medicaginis]
MNDAVKAGAYLHHMVLRSPDPAKMAVFYADVMNMPARQEGDVWICEGPMRRMAFIAGDRGLASAGFACRDADALAMMRARVEAEQLEILPPEGHWFGDEAFGVRDDDGNLVVFGLSSHQTASKGVRGPLQHLTLASRDPDAIEGFYVGKLGFITSDYARASDGRTLALWTRSNHEHHTLACFRRGRQGIDHFSFEAGDWSVLKEWCDRMGEHHVPIVWGPGRHGPGNNLFIFVEDPDRNWIEISAELEVIYDRPSHTWPAEDRTLNMWGKAIYRD